MTQPYQLLNSGRGFGFLVMLNRILPNLESYRAAEKCILHTG